MKWADFLHTKRLQKTFGLIVLIVFFTIIYSFLDSSHFQGINPIQDKMKDNIVEKKIENDPHLETFSTNYLASFEKKLEVKENVKEVVKDD